MLLLSPRFFVRSVRDAHADEYAEPITWTRRRVVCGDELAVALPPGGGRLADARGVRPAPQKPRGKDKKSRQAG